MQRQKTFIKTHWKHRFSHGGSLRKKELGRGARPLSTREPLHGVFKLNKLRLKSRSLRSNRCFALSQKVIQIYAQRFFVKIEQLSIQNDHIHLLIRTTKRSQYHYFFRVVAGQIAQRFDQEELLVTDTPGSLRSTASLGRKRGLHLWIERPFSRVVRGFRALKIVVAYIELNEKEARREIMYHKTRLRGMSPEEWEGLWLEAKSRRERRIKSG